jgi:hypothetical protein
VTTPWSSGIVSDFRQETGAMAREIESRQGTHTYIHTPTYIRRVFLMLLLPWPRGLGSDIVYGFHKDTGAMDREIESRQGIGC